MTTDCLRLGVLAMEIYDDFQGGAAAADDEVCASLHPRLRKPASPGCATAARGPDGARCVLRV